LSRFAGVERSIDFRIPVVETLKSLLLAYARFPIDTFSLISKSVDFETVFSILDLYQSLSLKSEVKCVWGGF
jgi:hypothetical protein